MNKLQAKYLKLHRQYKIRADHHARDMFEIKQCMISLIVLFGEEIMWDNLHNTDKNSQMHKLQLIIKDIRNLAIKTEKESNEERNEQTTI